MRTQIDRINATVDTLSGNMDKFDNKMNVLSANVAGLNKIANQLATDVGKIKKNDATQPYDPWRTGGYWR
jgi:outer membrane murein-binding lipoprotein Lpp